MSESDEESKKSIPRIRRNENVEELLYQQEPEEEEFMPYSPQKHWSVSGFLEELLAQKERQHEESKKNKKKSPVGCLL
jgi:hypothetical protein